MFKFSQAASVMPVSLVAQFSTCTYSWFSSNGNDQPPHRLCLQTNYSIKENERDACLEETWKRVVPGLLNSELETINRNRQSYSGWEGIPISYHPDGEDICQRVARTHGFAKVRIGPSAPWIHEEIIIILGILTVFMKSPNSLLHRSKTSLSRSNLWGVSSQVHI